MAHLIDSIAYVNATPWHGLGNKLPDGTNDIDIWRKEAGLDWDVLRAPVKFEAANKMLSLPERHVLYRSDNLMPLSIMSKSYKIVQPNEVLEFYRELVEAQGYNMHTAGSLDEGRRIWCLAEVGKEVTVKKDKIGGFLLLATSMDGTLATKAMFTTVRVVCNNTLRLAYDNGNDAIVVRHNQKFDADSVRTKMGIEGSWSVFADNVVTLSNRKLTRKEADTFVFNVFGDNEKTFAEQEARVYKQMGDVINLFNGKAIGSNLESAEGTAWGMVNAVTEYIDHHSARASNTRMNSAWFGRGSNVKSKAYDLALQLVA